MEWIILIVVVCMLVPGSGPSGGSGDSVALVLCFIVCVALIYGWVGAPVFVVHWLDDTYGPRSYHWWVYPSWYIGSLVLNYFLAVRDEKHRARVSEEFNRGATS